MSQPPQFVNWLTNQPIVITTTILTDNGAANTVWGNPTSSPALRTDTSNPVLGNNGGTGGSVTLVGSSTGSCILQVASAAGTGTVFQFPTSVGSSNQFLQTSGSGVTLWASINTSGSLVSIVTYSASQTITIPATATKAQIQMWGASGGSGGASSTLITTTGGTGAPAYLEKYLTGLTPGNTIIYQQGAAGAAGSSAGGNGGSGGGSQLSSGTQSISTLTTFGSLGSAGSTTTGDTSGTIGGTASGGDLNLTGQAGTTGISDSTNGEARGGTGGSLALAWGANGVAVNGASSAGNAGVNGGLIIKWFT